MPSRPQHLTKHCPSPSTTLYTVSNAPIRATRLSRLTYRLGLLTRLALVAGCLFVLGLWARGFADCYATTDAPSSSPSSSAGPAPNGITGALLSWSAHGLHRLASFGRPASLERFRQRYRSSSDILFPRRPCGPDPCPIPEKLEWLEKIAGTCVTSVVAGKLARGWIDWAPAVVCMAIIFWLARRDHIEEQLLVIRGLGIQTSSSSPSYLSSPTTRFIPTSQIQDIFIHEAFIGFEVRFYLAVIVEGEEQAVVVFPKLLPKRAILEEIWRGSKSVLYQSSKKR